MLLCSVGGPMARETFTRLSAKPEHLGARTNMTTRFPRATLFLWLAVFAASGFAQSKPATPAATAEPLAPVAWLVGGTWVSDVKDPSDGTATHVENRIRD